MKMNMSIYFFGEDGGRMGRQEAYCLGYDGANCYFSVVDEPEFTDFYDEYVADKNKVLTVSKGGNSAFLIGKIKEIFDIKGTRLEDLNVGGTVYAGMGNIGTYVGELQVNVEEN